MEKNSRVKMMLSWSVLLMALIALFWTVVYFVTGSVPVTDEIKITETYSLQLPFSISRWWDVLLGPIIATSFVLVFTSNSIKNNKCAEKDMVGVLFFVLLIVIIFGVTGLFVHGLMSWLTLGLLTILVLGLPVGLLTMLFDGLEAALILGMLAGLVGGLVAGLAAGLAFVLAWVMIFGLIYGLLVLVALVIVVANTDQVGSWFFDRKRP